MSLLSMLESTGVLYREEIGRDSQGGTTQTPTVVSPVVPCSVQTASSTTVMMYGQRNSNVNTTVFFAQDIKAQINDVFVATDAAGNTFGVRVIGYRQEVNRVFCWRIDGLWTQAPTGTSSSTGTVGFLITVPDEVVQGVPFNFTVGAIDAEGNPVATYGGTVQFYSTDIDAVLPADSTLIGGTGTFSATLNTLGEWQLGAQDNVNYSINTVSDGINVVSVSQGSFAGNSTTFSGSDLSYAGAT